ncbi:MAG: recombinase family protein [Solirubrobacteraceae bacterium]|nr:recombinase family protein [Solirubrobacteraceae bacterium]
MEAGTKVIGYTRVSTAERVAGSHGLDAQEAAIRAEAERRGWLLVGIECDAGATGKDTDRPGLAAALEAVKGKRAEGLIVAKLDRLSRSVVDFGSILEAFDRMGATLVALDLGVDTSTPGGRLVANVFASVAQWEAETISLRTKEGLDAARAKGLPISRPSVADVPGLRERITGMRAAGRTMQSIADELNADGVPTLRGAPKWTTNSVNTALGYKRPAKRRKALAL